MKAFKVLCVLTIFLAGSLRADDCKCDSKPLSVSQQLQDIEMRALIKRYERLINERENLRVLMHEMKHQEAGELELSLPKGIKNVEQLIAHLDKLTQEIVDLRHEILKASGESDAPKKEKSTSF